MNPQLYALIWAAGLLAAIYLAFTLIGMRSMVAMFPEGWRWWMLPAQLGALAFFALVVLFNPWR